MVPRSGGFVPLDAPDEHVYVSRSRRPQAGAAFTCSPGRLVLLNELLTRDRLKIPLEATTKEAVLAELVGTLGRGPEVGDHGEVLRAVMEREEVLSTGIGNGVAIPHGRTSAVGSLVLSAGVTREPVEFDALDGQPVRLFFLLVGPDATAGQHVKALSRISRLLRKESFRERLTAARDADEFLAVLDEAENS
jgi:mannitol/fructose-specific phosphotransferase system IIA component (Ntr-type)